VVPPSSGARWFPPRPQDSGSLGGRAFSPPQRGRRLATAPAAAGPPARPFSLAPAAAFGGGSLRSTRGRMRLRPPAGFAGRARSPFTPRAPRAARLRRPALGGLRR